MRFCVIFLFLCALSSFGAWEPSLPRGLPGFFTDIVFYDGAYWMTRNGDGIYTSRDLQNWTLDFGEADGAEGIGYTPPGRLKVVAGELVATGGRELIMTRSKAGKWIVRHQVESGLYSVNDITYGGGKWVAVGGKTTAQGGESLMLISDDLISWTVRHDTFPLRLNSADFIEERFVIGGGHFETGGWIFKTSNLEDWEMRQVSANPVTSVVRSEKGWTATTGTAEGLFGSILHSADGAEWAELPLKPTIDRQMFRRLDRAVWFQGGLDVIGNEVILRSEDGIVWREVLRLPEGIEIHGITECAEGLAAVGSAGLILTSRDGVTWLDLNRAVPSPDDGSPVSLANGAFFSNAFGLVYSDNGSDWMQLDVVGAKGIGTPVLGDDRLFALAGHGAIVESRDGRKWQEVYPGGERDPTLFRIAWWRGELWGVGPWGLVLHGTPETGFATVAPPPDRDYSFEMLASEDGLLIWSYRDVYRIAPEGRDAESVLHLPEGAFIQCIACGGGRYVLSGLALIPGQPQANAVMISDDGSEWSVHEDVPATFSSLAFGDGVFRGSAEGGVWVSFDGFRWTKEERVSVESLVVSYRSSRWWLSDPINTILRYEPRPNRLVNVSARVWIESGQTAIFGFVTSGSDEQDLLVRAVGPDLGQFDVPDTLMDPTFCAVDQGEGTQLKSETEGSPMIERRARIEHASSAAGAFPLSEVMPGENADLYRVGPGAYTILVRSRSGASGMVLIEAYAFGPNSSRIVNASLRTQLSNISPPPIFGFVSSSPGAYLLRAVDESLQQFGIKDSGVGVRFSGFGKGGAFLFSSEQFHDSIPEKVLEYHTQRSGAFSLEPDTDESPVLVMLPEGVATFLLSPGSTVGETLFEVYERP